MIYLQVQLSQQHEAEKKYVKVRTRNVLPDVIAPKYKQSLKLNPSEGMSNTNPYIITPTAKHEMVVPRKA